MKIGIIGSLQFTEKLVEVQNKLNSMGHETFLLSEFPELFIGKSNEEKEEIKLQQKYVFSCFLREEHRLALVLYEWKCGSLPYGATPSTIAFVFASTARKLMLLTQQLNTYSFS